MSFASDVKRVNWFRSPSRTRESRISSINSDERLACLVNQQFVLNVQTENAAIARRMYSLLKDHYHAQAELLVRKNETKKKNNVYIVRLKQDTQKF